MQVGVGKASFTEKALTENITSLINEIKRVKPAGAKGNYMKKVTVSSTMGPGIKIDLVAMSEAAKAA